MQTKRMLEYLINHAQVVQMNYSLDNDTYLVQADKMGEEGDDLKETIERLYHRQVLKNTEIVVR